MIEGDGGAAVGREVGKVGSVGPAPGAAIGLPSMVLLHPATSTTVASMPHRANGNNRTRFSPESEISGSQITHERAQVIAVTRFWNGADGKALLGGGCLAGLFGFGGSTA